MGTKDSKHSNSQGNTLFRSAVGDTQPIRQRERDQSKPRAPAKKHDPQQRPKQFSTADDIDQYVSTATSPGEKLNFQRSSVSRKVMRDLRRGKFPVAEEIDLHGMTEAEALKALRDFVSYCSGKRLPCVRVVHGKGLGSGSRGPVIKAGVNNWLQQWDEVLAYCSATDRDGGTGAVYLLLKTR